MANHKYIDFEAEVAKRKRWQNTDTSMVNQAYIDSFLKDADSYFNTAESDYGALNWGNATNSYNTRNQTWNDLTQRADAVGAWLYNNRNSISKDVYNSYNDYLNAFSSGGSDLLNAFKGTADLYGSFDSQEAYDAWKKEQDNYEAIRNSADYSKYVESGKNSQGNSFFKDILNIADGQHYTIKELVSDIKEGDWLNLGGKAFEQILGRISPQVSNALKTASTGLDVRELAGEWLVDRSRMDKYLTDDEMDMYHYYIGKGDYQAAEDYYNNYSNLAKVRSANELTKMFNQSLGETGVAFGSGVSSFVSGYDTALSRISSLLYDKETKIQDPTVLQYAFSEMSADNKGLWDITNKLAQTIGNQVPSMVMNAMTGGVGGAAVMGFSASGNAYAEAINSGEFTETQAIAYATSIGFLEAKLQEILGGITGLGSEGGIVSKQAEKLIPQITKALPNILRKLGNLALSTTASSLDEGFEEAVQEILDPFVKALTTGNWEGVEDLSTFVDWGAVGESALLGALSGGLLEGGTNAINMGTTAVGVNQAFKDVRNDPDSLKALLTSIAMENPNADIKPLMDKFNEGKKISTKELKNLVYTNEEALWNKDKAKLTDATEARLTELGETNNARKLAESIVNAQYGDFTQALDASEQAIANNKNLGIKDLAYLMAEQSTESKGKISRKDKKTLKENNAAFMASNELNPDYVKNHGGYAKDKTSRLGQTAASVATTRAKVEALKTLNDSRKNIPSPSFNYESGVVAPHLNEKGVQAKENASATAYANEMGYRGTTNEAFSKYYKGEDLEKYGLAFNEAYEMGKQGIPKSELDNASFKGYANEEAVDMAYQSGVLDAKYEAIKTEKIKVKGGATVTVPMSTNGLKESQKATIELMKVLAEVTHTNMAVMQSVTSHGLYDPKTNTISIDINLGGRDFMITSLSHELTHHLAKAMPEKFDEFARVLFEEVGKVKSVNEAIALWKKNNKKYYPKYTEAELNALAREEVVAEMCESFLTDEKVAQRISQKVYETDKGLWNTIKKWLEDFVAKIKSLFSDIDPQSENGRIVKEMGDKLDAVKQMWADMVVESGEITTEATQEQVKNSRKDLEKLDADYLSAVERGDMETAQKMVDEAAKKAGYTIKAYHGTKADFTVFEKSKIGSGATLFASQGKGFYFTENNEVANQYSKVGKVVNAYLKMENAFAFTDKTNNTANKLLKEFAQQNGRDFNIGEYSNFVDFEERTGSVLSRVVMGDGEAFSEFLQEKRYDGIVYTSFNYDTNRSDKCYVVFDSNQIKSADPVTYGDEGNVIPLSQRFNEENEDIRYSRKDSEGNTLTEAQAEFFKDSKVRDENGRLLEVYHGTKKGGFTQFIDTDDIGYFFTNRKTNAATYSGTYDEFAPKRFDSWEEAIEYGKENDLDITFDEENNVYVLADYSGWETEWNVDELDKLADELLLETYNGGDKMNYSVYLNLINPLIINGDGSWWTNVVDHYEGGEFVTYDELTEEQVEAFLDNGYEEYDLRDWTDEGGYPLAIFDIANYEISFPMSTREWVREAEAGEYDGVIFKNINDSGGELGSYIYESDVYVALKANQIKSTANTNPTKHPDIRYSRKNGIDNYTQKEYNDFGWVRWNNVISAGRWKNFTENFAQAVTGLQIFPKSNLDEFMIEVYDAYDPMSDYDAIVFAKGTIESPIITRIIKFNSTNHTLLEETRGDIYALEKRGIRQKIGRIFNSYSSTDFPWSANGRGNNNENARYNNRLGVKRRRGEIVANPIVRIRVDEETNTITTTYRNGQITTSVLEEQSYKHSRKTPDPFTSREALAKALSKVAKGEDRAIVESYKANVNLIKGETERANNLRKEIDEIKYKKSITYEGRELSVKEFEQIAYTKAEEQGIDAEKVKFKALRDTGKYVAMVDGKKFLEAEKRFRSKEDIDKLATLEQNYNATLKRISGYDKKLLQIEAMSSIKQLIAREKKVAYDKAKSEGKVALKEAKEQAISKQKEITAKYQEARHKNVEGRRTTEMRHKLLNTVHTLDQLLVNPTKKKHIPIGLQKPIAEALNVLNRETDSVRMAESLARLKIAYGKILESDDYIIRNSHDDVISNMIDKLIDEVKDTPVREMNLEQSELAYNTYRAILKSVRDANKAFAAAKGEEITKLADDVMGELETYERKNKAIPTVLDNALQLEWTNLKPTYAFERIGSSTFTELYNNIRHGEDVWAKDVNDARAFFDKQKKQYGFDKWDFKKKYAFTSKHGRNFELTLEQIMSIYAYTRRGDQAIEHLINGGFVFDKHTVSEKKSKSGITYEVVFDDPKAYSLSEEIIGQINATLTEQQTAFVKAMQEYLSKTMGNKGNEVSRQLYDINIFGEENYFPLKTSEVYKERVREQARGEVKIKNKGFTKETTPHSTAPVVLTPFTDVWATHCIEMSMYHAFTLPLEDFYRVYNYKERADLDSEEDGVTRRLEEAFGKAATNYIDQLLVDVNGGTRGDPRASALDKGLATFKKAKVMGSLSVVIQQPSAIVRAIAYIDLKYFIDKPSKPNHKANWEELKKYAPVAIIKEMGKFDVGVGQSTVDWVKNNPTLRDKIDEVVSKAPAYADEMGWISIWKAVKREVAATTDLKVNSEEFLQRCGERFTEVVTKTQVYDSVFARSGYMRSKDVGAKMFTAFMAEPTTTLNILEDAVMKAFRGNPKFMARAITSCLASSLINSALVSVVYAMRDDEDEEYWKKYLSTLGETAIDNINPLNMMPYIRDIWSMVEGYRVSRSDLTLWQEIIWDINKLNKNGYAKFEDWVNVITSISQVTGIPLKNLLRDARGIWNTAKSLIK